jgi:hypothetical protein
LRAGVGHIDHKAFAVPRSVNCHQSDLDGWVKANPDILFSAIDTH